MSAMFSLTRWALEHEYALPDLELRRPTLEEVYLQLTTSTDQWEPTDDPSRPSSDALRPGDVRPQPSGSVFTVLLPVMFLATFVSVFGNQLVGPEHIQASTYFVPGLPRSPSSARRSRTS